MNTNNDNPTDHSSNDPEGVLSPALSTRKNPFLGFTDGSRQDEELVKALLINNPFKAAHGEKGPTWNRVLSHLQSIDELAASQGRELMFEGASVKSCKLRWDILFAKHQSWLKSVMSQTGAVPMMETAHQQRIDEIFNDQVNHDGRRTESKELNAKKRQRQQDNRAMGAALRAASTTMACYPVSSLPIADSRHYSDSGSSDKGNSSDASSISIESDFKKRRRKAEEAIAARMEASKARMEELASTRLQLTQQADEKHEALMRRIDEGNQYIAMTIQKGNNELVEVLRADSAQTKEVNDNLLEVLKANCAQTKEVNDNLLMLIQVMAQRAK
ncbi:hypothetical protein FBU30_007697 [Linnemannia zychae]|nr:hypothetical protein FBU30_007697 [Linnemannia zychae]